MLIVDMKMPKRCFDCPMHDWTYGQHETRQNVLVCNARHGLEPILSRVIPNGDERPDWCPIKGVLPDKHGDLIDRDKFVDKYIRHYTEQERKMNLVFAAVEVKQDFADMIYEEDAVIAAERKDDGK